MQKRVITLALMWLISFATGAQPADSVLFSFQDFLGYVRNYHPIVVQAGLKVQQAESAIMVNRGSLDPKLYGSVNQKEFSEKTYYSLWESGLKVPTWFGADFKVAYEQNTGDYLNPERTVPEDGQLAVGVSVPLLRNLVYNDRRVAIQQAKLMQAATEQERLQIVNDLLYEASKAYWYWQNAFAAWRINAESVAAAQTRFEAVRTSFFRGEKPAVDTLESLIQLQNRIFNTQEARLGFQNASLVLSNFLWFENQTPIEIREGTFPPLITGTDLPILLPDTLNRLLAGVPQNHPELGQMEVAINSLGLQRKLQINNMLPELTVDYSLLSGSLTNFENYTGSLNATNYKVGINFSVPLYLRKDRGYLQIVNAKISETESKRDLKVRQIQNKVRAADNQLSTLAGQVVLYNQTYQNYESLLNAELRKFGMGESTLFLVNSREQKAIEARLKRAELIAKYQIAYQSIWYSAGALR